MYNRHRTLHSAIPPYRPYVHQNANTNRYNKRYAQGRYLLVHLYICMTTHHWRYSSWHFRWHRSYYILGLIGCNC